ncbi:MAG: type II secretion system protein M [Gammaproteobacteria bacterium]|nr:type II secretion system protein M [Gammaproteobacteria bacterium]
MRAWFESRNESEKRLLTLAALVVAGALYFLLVIDPMSQANARLATRLSAAQELQAHLSKLADEMKSLGGAASKQRTTLPPGASLLNVVTTSAHAAGVQQHTKKMAPVGANALSLYLDDMPFNELAQWLVNLDQQQGIEVERATIEALPVIGTVRADLTLKARL